MTRCHPGPCHIHVPEMSWACSPIVENAKNNNDPGIAIHRMDHTKTATWNLSTAVHVRRWRGPDRGTNVRESVPGIAARKRSVRHGNIGWESGIKMGPPHSRGT